MARKASGVSMVVCTLLVSGCGTLIEGEHARLDHWGPLPVVCLGECSALDPYYYDKQPAGAGQSATKNAAGAEAPTAETNRRAVRRAPSTMDTSPAATPIP